MACLLARLVPTSWRMGQPSREVLVWRLATHAPVPLEQPLSLLIQLRLALHAVALELLVPLLVPPLSPPLALRREPPYQAPLGKPLVPLLERHVVRPMASPVVQPFRSRQPILPETPGRIPSHHEPDRSCDAPCGWFGCRQGGSATGPRSELRSASVARVSVDLVPWAAVASPRGRR